MSNSDAVVMHLFRAFCTCQSKSSAHLHLATTSQGSVSYIFHPKHRKVFCKLAATGQRNVCVCFTCWKRAALEGIARWPRVAQHLYSIYSLQLYIEVHWCPSGILWAECCWNEMNANESIHVHKNTHAVVSSCSHVRFLDDTFINYWKWRQKVSR